MPSGVGLACATLNWLGWLKRLFVACQSHFSSAVDRRLVSES